MGITKGKKRISKREEQEDRLRTEAISWSLSFRKYFTASFHYTRKNETIRW